MFALNIFILAIVLALVEFVRVFYDEQSNFSCFFLLKILNIMRAAERKHLLFSATTNATTCIESGSMCVRSAVTSKYDIAITMNVFIYNTGSAPLRKRRRRRHGVYSACDVGLEGQFKELKSFRGSTCLKQCGPTGRTVSVHGRRRQ